MKDPREEAAIDDILKNLGLDGIAEKTSKLKKELEDIEATGTAGADMVVAVVSGAFRVKSIRISEEAFRDREILEDLIASAVNVALDNAEAETKEKCMGDLLVDAPSILSSLRPK